MLTSSRLTLSGTSLPAASVIAIAAAVGLGIVAAVVPLNTVLLTIAALGLIVCCLMTPAAALVVVLVTSPLRALIEVRAPGLLPLDAMQLGLLAFFGIWFLTRIAQRKPLLRVERSLALLALAVFIAGAAPSLLTAVSVGAWINEWLKWILALVLALLVMQIGSWRLVMLGLAFAGLAQAILGIWIYQGGSGAEHFLIDATHYRAFGTFEQPNPFGGFVAMLTPLLLSIAFGNLRALISRWRSANEFSSMAVLSVSFYSVCAGLTAVAAILSWSRGAWLALGAGLAILAFASFRKIWRGALIVGLGGVLVLLGFLSGRLPASLTDRLISAGSELVNVRDVRGVDITPDNYAVIERLAHWQAALNMAEASPWLGIGFGGYEPAYEQYRLLPWEVPLGHAHNYYLNVLGETGMIGFFAYLIMWFVLAVQAWRIRAHPDSTASAVGAGLLGAWTVVLVHSVTDNLFVNSVFLHIGVTIGICAVLYRETWTFNKASFK
jgi:O-antigen ligase